VRTLWARLTVPTGPEMAFENTIIRTSHLPPAACRAGVPPPGSTGGGRGHCGQAAPPTDAVATPAKRKPGDAALKEQGQGHSHEIHSGSAAKRSKPAAQPPPRHPAHVGQQRQQKVAAAQPAGMKLPPILPRKRGRPRKNPEPPEQRVAMQAVAAAAPPLPTPAGGGIAATPRPAAQQQQQMAPAAAAAAAAAPAALHPALVAAVQQQGPLMQGTAVNLPRLHALLQQQAAAQAAMRSSGPAGLLPGLWRQAQAVVLQQSLQLLVRQLEAMPPPPTEQVRGGMELLSARHSAVTPLRSPHPRPQRPAFIMLTLLPPHTSLRPS
jgi:hypothetical protein